MTPHPDTATPQTTIMDALHRMNGNILLLKEKENLSNKKVDNINFMMPTYNI